MSNFIKTEVTNYFVEEISRLKKKELILISAQKKFDLSKEATEEFYSTARAQVLKNSRKKALVYFLIGSSLIFLGIYGTFHVKSVALYSFYVLGAISVLRSAFYVRIVIATKN